MRFQRKPVAVAIALVLIWPAVDAAEHATPPAAAATRLGTVRVTATPAEGRPDERAGTATAQSREEIDRRVPADEADLFRNDPDVALPRDLRRFGATRVNIRGIEDNRVFQMVDGVRLPDWYNGGGPTNFTLSAPLGASMEFLRGVQVLRGPASSLYGSDAIGGVVAYSTLTPTDLLADGEGTGALYRLGRAGANEALTNTLLGAWRGEVADGLVGYTYTRAREFDNQGEVGTTAPTRTRPNPQALADQGVLAKLGFRPAAGHKLGVTLEGRRQDNEVTVERLSVTLPKVTAMWGEDRGTRERVGLDWEHAPKDRFYDRLTTLLYWQASDTENFNKQNRSNTSAACSAVAGSGNDCYIEQDFFFRQDTVGVIGQFQSVLGTAGREQLLTYGADVSRVKTDELRDARVYNLTTGSASNTLLGDTFPLRDFAIGETDTIGLFVQDEIARGRFSVTPGLRYDWRRLTPKVDALAQQVLDNIDRAAVEKTFSAVSPKLAALWRLDASWTLYGQAVSGFRAPTYEEVNGAFRNNVQRYGTSPNPELRAETSVGVELGAKAHARRVRAQVAVYDNRYQDFIENVRLNCPGDSRCLPGLSNTFMFVNQARVRIYGAELRGAWDYARGWNLDGALAWARGENESAGQPLNSVEPARATLALVRDAEGWGAETRLRAANKVARTDDRDGAWFRPGGYGVLDISAWWRPTKRARVNVAVHNVFDKKYWLWGDIRQADTRNPAGVDFYSQPGRTFSASLNVPF